MSTFEDKRLNSEFMRAVLVNFEANLQTSEPLTADYILSRLLDAFVMTAIEFGIDSREFPWNRLRGAA